MIDHRNNAVNDYLSPSSLGSACSTEVLERGLLPTLASLIPQGRIIAMPKKSSRQFSWLRLSSMGFELVGALLGFGAVGYVIDQHYGIAPRGLVTCIVLGLIGGLYNLVKQALLASKRVDTDDLHGNNGPTHDRG